MLRGIDPDKEVTRHGTREQYQSGTLAGPDRIRPVRAAQEDRARNHDESDPNPPATEHPGIVIGKELSLRLGSFVGDTVNVVSPVGPVSAIGMVPKIRIFTVVAIFESGMFEYDSSLAYIGLEEAQKFFNMNQTVTGIEVKVDEIFSRARDCARH